LGLEGGDAFAAGEDVVQQLTRSLSRFIVDC
jgi:hypothetical protein